MNYFSKPSWSPYVVGAGIGILACLRAYFLGAMLGVSTGFVQLAALLEYFVMPEYVANSAYFTKYVTPKPFIGFKVLIGVGIIIGAWLASSLSGDRQKRAVPALWAKTFGRSFTVRAIGAFIGGVIIIFGARIAGGCTSGLAISSGLQLGLSAWVFMTMLFVSGIITAHLVYRK